MSVRGTGQDAFFPWEGHPRGSVVRQLQVEERNSEYCHPRECFWKAGILGSWQSPRPRGRGAAQAGERALPAFPPAPELRAAPAGRRGGGVGGGPGARGGRRGQGAGAPGRGGGDRGGPGGAA